MVPVKNLGDNLLKTQYMVSKEMLPLESKENCIRKAGRLPDLNGIRFQKAFTKS